MKKGERAYKVIATRATKCHECSGYIYPGQPLIIYKIPYHEASGGFRKTRYHNHLIHPHHWKPYSGYVIDLTEERKAKK